MVLSPQCAKPPMRARVAARVTHSMHIAPGVYLIKVAAGVAMPPASATPARGKGAGTQCMSPGRVMVGSGLDAQCMSPGRVMVGSGLDAQCMSPGRVRAKIRRTEYKSW